MITKCCPRDSAVLASNDVDGYRYYSCPKCQGFWIPGSVLRKTMRLEAAQDIIGKLPQASGSNLPCPNGDSRLVAEMVRVCEIDVCPGCHSVWLDRREALAIANCFRRPSPIVEADGGANCGRIPASLIILDAIGNIVTLFFR